MSKEKDFIVLKSSEYYEFVKHRNLAHCEIDGISFIQIELQFKPRCQFKTVVIPVSAIKKSTIELFHI